MALGRMWAGKLYGTNTGNLFVKFDGLDDNLSGLIHINDPTFGLSIYSINGNFNGETLAVNGKVINGQEGVEFGSLSATAKLNARGELEGEWKTDIGSAGTFVLFPHEINTVADNDSRKQDLLFSSREDFGAVAVDGAQITALADEIQANFNRSKVVVTVSAGTEKTRLLDDFKKAKHGIERVTLFKLYARESEANGIDRIVIVEFGPEANWAMSQGSDEAWVLGMMEKLKQLISPMERKYSTNFKKHGFGIAQILIFGALVYLPSLDDIYHRALLMIGVLCIVYAFNFLHKQYLPFSALTLLDRPNNFTSKVLPNVVSWVFAASSALVAALLASLLAKYYP